MRHVALEVPLRALALVRRRKCRDTADAGIEALGDALDDTALAGGVSALEQYDDLLPLALHPVLELDQLTLEPEQFPEIEPAIHRRAGRVRLVQQLVEPGVVELELQLFVEIVGHFPDDAFALGHFKGAVGCGHGSFSRAEVPVATTIDGVYCAHVTPGRKWPGGAVTPAARSNISPGSAQSSTRSRRCRRAGSAWSSGRSRRRRGRPRRRAADSRGCRSSDSIPAPRPISRSRARSG